MNKKPVYVISGYLGAGKTTFTQNLLQDQLEENTILMVNELSPFSIDKNLINLKQSNIIDLSGGCACCNLGNKMKEGIAEAVSRREISQIFIETTGVALPGQLMQMALNVDGSRHGGVITVIDAAVFLNSPADRHLMDEQVVQSDLIIINKIDLVDPDQLIAIEQDLKEKMRPTVSLIRTSYSKTNMEEIDRVLAGVQPGPVIELYCDTVSGKYDTLLFIKKGDVDHNHLEEALSNPGIVRAKGLLDDNANNTLFQYAGGRFEYSKHPYPIRATQLVVIVKSENRDAVESNLKPLFARS